MRRATQASIFVPASPTATFGKLADHEGTPGWVPKAKVVVLTTPGAPTKNGLGAVRRVTFRPMGWGTIDERVTAFDEAVWFEFNPWLWAPFAGTFVRTFTGAMNEGLETLAAQGG